MTATAHANSRPWLRAIASGEGVYLPLTLAAIFVGGGRHFFEALLRSELPRTPIFVVHNAVWYLAVAVTLAAIVAWTATVSFREAGRLTSAGLALGVLPPLIDHAWYGRGVVEYVYLFDVDWLFRMTADGGYIGELAAVWLAIAAVGGVAGRLSASWSRGAIAAGFAYAAMLWLASFYPAWLAGLVRGGPLEPTIGSFQTLAIQGMVAWAMLMSAAASRETARRLAASLATAITSGVVVAASGAVTANAWADVTWYWAVSVALLSALIAAHAGENARLNWARGGAGVYALAVASRAPELAALLAAYALAVGHAVRHRGRRPQATAAAVAIAGLIGVLAPTGHMLLRTSHWPAAVVAIAGMAWLLMCERQTTTGRWSRGAALRLAGALLIPCLGLWWRSETAVWSLLLVLPIVAMVASTGYIRNRSAAVELLRWSGGVLLLLIVALFAGE